MLVVTLVFERAKHTKLDDGPRMALDRGRQCYVEVRDVYVYKSESFVAAVACMLQDATSIRADARF